MTVEQALKEAMLSGVKSAYELLEEASSEVAKENQTWESAIAQLKLLEASLSAAVHK